MKNGIFVVFCKNELTAYKLLADMKMDEPYGDKIHKWEMSDKMIKPCGDYDRKGEYTLVFTSDVSVKNYFVKKYDLENIYRSKRFNFNGEL